jgi:ketosteroid isomerase-like protein
MGEARQVVERFYESFAAGDLDSARACFGDDCVTVTPMGELNVSQHEAFARALKAGLPDMRMEITRAAEAGDHVFVHGRFRGTHTADLVSPTGTLPASGNNLDLAFADYFHVGGGRIVAHEIIWDQLGLLGQLGGIRR